VRVRGAALALDGPVIETLRILSGGRVVGETAVDKACPELAFLPFPRAGECRFETMADAVDELRVVYADGREEAVFRFGAARPAIVECIERLPRPTPELVAATQGGGDVGSYLDSMISGLHTLQSLLRAGGVDAREVRGVLDIGCGTGRLLMGWHCADRSRRIAGVDINAELIGWSRANLPGEWAVCDVLPPLDVHGFDLVQLASVFTHLPLDHQKRWIEEIRRVLHRNGILVITLHGAIYKRIFGQSGEYSELPTGAIGSNAFATFHTKEFAERLFTGFELLGWFERGHDADPPSLFPIAALQDVYIFRKV
jgi:SAM-dependent methyltransferase